MVDVFICKQCGKTVTENDFSAPSDYVIHKSIQLCEECAKITGKALSHQEFMEFGDTISTIVEEVCIAGMTIKKGDIVEITFGRNRTVRGRFKAWSNKLYALTVETNEGEMLIPYKYIKMLLKVR
ncbi:MAG: hypothetical protein DRJ03_16745 [Chloroflexi bacterium]|nr:MAG: hypothetical protein DRJ03_16745 [Chloroflexota bacterium]